MSSHGREEWWRRCSVLWATRVVQASSPDLKREGDAGGPCILTSSEGALGLRPPLGLGHHHPSHSHAHVYTHPGADENLEARAQRQLRSSGVLAVVPELCKTSPFTVDPHLQPGETQRLRSFLIPRNLTADGTHILVWAAQPRPGLDSKPGGQSSDGHMGQPLCPG